MEKGKKKPWGTTLPIPELRIKIDVQVFCLWVNLNNSAFNKHFNKPKELVYSYYPKKHMLDQVQVLWKSIMLKTNITKKSELLQEEQVCAKVLLSPSYVIWMEVPASFLPWKHINLAFLLFLFVMDHYWDLLV